MEPACEGFYDQLSSAASSLRAMTLPSTTNADESQSPVAQTEDVSGTFPDDDWPLDRLVTLFGQRHSYIGLDH
jgi:hypothetical protein